MKEGCSGGASLCEGFVKGTLGVATAAACLGTFDILYLIYLLNAVGLTPGGSSTVHIYAQTGRRSTQLTTNWEECGPCPIFESYTLAFALQLREKHGKTLVRVE